MRHSPYKLILGIFLLLALGACGGGSSGGQNSGGNGTPSASTDASLSALSMSNLTLDQTFQSNSNNYTASADFLDTSTTVTATATDTNATISIDSIAVASGIASPSIALSEGANNISITVTAEDGITTETYTITVTRAASSTDASLSALTLTDLTLDQIFQPTQNSYTASIGFLGTSIMVTATTADPLASVSIDGMSVTSGISSPAIALSEGVNNIDVIVTAADTINTETYTISVTRASPVSFAQQAYLKASNAGAGDRFAGSVAISGDTLVVGAANEDSNAAGAPMNDSAPSAGAAYVFVRSGGVWTQQAYLKASNIDSSDQFGSSVAIDGDTVVIGAPGEQGSGNLSNQAGAVYVFTRTSDVWTQQAYLKASNAEVFDEFGTSVSISGDTLIVGAPGESSSASGGETDNSESESGAAYVFVRSGNIWTQQAYLKASNAGFEDLFGSSVAVDEDTAVIGALYEWSDGSGEGNNLAEAAGAAYVFTRSAGVWAQQAYLKASNAEEFDEFGTSVSLSGDTIIVGAPFESGSATGGGADNLESESGAAYIFTRSGVTWTQQAYLKASNAGDSDEFGYSVAISKGSVIVGAPTEASGASGPATSNSEFAAGAAYVFTGSGSVWTQQALVKASNAQASDSFGLSVAISGDTVVVGADGEDSTALGGEANNDASNSGAAYVSK